MASNDQNLDDALGHEEESLADAWKCEDCKGQFCGDHYSVPWCNETGDGVQLCELCCLRRQFESVEASRNALRDSMKGLRGACRRMLDVLDESGG